jgi:hypothetical protein
LTTPTFFSTNDETYLSTTYYNNTPPPSYITPHSPIASLHVINDLTTLAFCWNLLLLVCFTIVTFLPSHLNKKRISKSINITNHHDHTKNPQEYQLIGLINYSEEQKEHAIIAQDNAYWTRESIGGPAQHDEEIYNAYYSTDDHIPKYKEVKEMFANDDGFFMDDSFLNRKGKTQSANP